MTRFGFVSTYPPTVCGLATFTSALRTELAVGGWATVISVLESGQSVVTAPEVAASLRPDDPRGLARAVALLASSDAVILQHEYGIYGGPDGEQVLDLLSALTVPTIVVLHTVLPTPSEHQRQILERVVQLADAVITMTLLARDLLATRYAVDLAKVTVIPHGAPALPARSGPTQRSAEPTVLTWGLLGPGKGIEWGIEAMSNLRGLEPGPRYVIAGRTHPKVLRHEGEAYRLRLQEQTRRLGLTDQIQFDDQYRDAAALAELVASADVVLLPYDSTDQATSGVLIEAVAALKPVVATAFPHAVELLSGGAGLVVPHRDPLAITEALRTVLTRRELTADMNRATTAIAAELAWPAVADRYRAVAAQVIRKRVAA